MSDFLIRPISNDNAAEVLRYRDRLWQQPVQPYVNNHDWGDDFWQGVAAYLDSELVGYRYQRRVATGILSAGSFGISPHVRGVGLGRLVSEAHEKHASPDIEMFVVFNEDPAPCQTNIPPDAAGFWQKVGYELVGENPHSRVLIKKRRRHQLHLAS